MYTFDGANRLIALSAGVRTFSVVDLYSRWKDWVMLSDNAKWIQAMRSIGNESIGGGQSISPYIILMNGWKIRPDEADHLLTVVGNLITDDESNAFSQTLGSYNVEIREVVTANSLTSATGPLSVSQAQYLERIYQAHYHRRAWSKVDDKIRIYDTDGTTVLYEFSTTSELEDINPDFTP